MSDYILENPYSDMFIKGDNFISDAKTFKKMHTHTHTLSLSLSLYISINFLCFGAWLQVVYKTISTVSEVYRN